MAVCCRRRRMRRAARTVRGRTRRHDRPRSQCRPCARLQRAAARRTMRLVALAHATANILDRASARAHTAGDDLSRSARHRGRPQRRAGQPRVHRAHSTCDCTARATTSRRISIALAQTARRLRQRVRGLSREHQGTVLGSVLDGTPHSTRRRDDYATRAVRVAPGGARDRRLPHRAVSLGPLRYLGMQSVIRERGFHTLEDAGDIGGNHESSFGVDEPSTVARMLDVDRRTGRGRPVLPHLSANCRASSLRDAGAGPFPDARRDRPIPQRAALRRRRARRA